MSRSQMKNHITIAFLLFLLSTAAYPQDLPDSIDAFADKNVEVLYVDSYDPAIVVLELPDGNTIETTYRGVELDTLIDWEAEQKKTGNPRTLHLSYSIREGVRVRDQDSGITFSLLGVIADHPIDRAERRCQDVHSSTLGIKHCMSLALKAWDAELNRAYKALGGSRNEKLKQAQRAWIKFRDAQFDYLREEYGNRDGTIWGIRFTEHVVNLTKTQANLLKSVL